MKARSLFVNATLGCVLLSACSSSESSSSIVTSTRSSGPQSSAYSEPPASLDDLVKSAPVVVVGQLRAISDPIELDDGVSGVAVVTFQLSKVISDPSGRLAAGSEATFLYMLSVGDPSGDVKRLRSEIESRSEEFIGFAAQFNEKEPPISKGSALTLSFGAPILVGIDPNGMLQLDNRWGFAVDEIDLDPALKGQSLSDVTESARRISATP
jgi:hypothetical protein